MQILLKVVWVQVVQRTPFIVVHSGWSLCRPLYKQNSMHSCVLKPLIWEELIVTRSFLFKTNKNPTPKVTQLPSWLLILGKKWQWKGNKNTSWNCCCCLQKYFLNFFFFPLEHGLNVSNKCFSLERSDIYLSCCLRGSTLTGLHSPAFFLANLIAIKDELKGLLFFFFYLDMLFIRTSIANLRVLFFLPSKEKVFGSPRNWIN